MNTHLRWRKSSRSGAANNCVEIADLPDGSVALRDSKNRGAGYLTFTPAAWAEFTAEMTGEPNS